MFTENKDVLAVINAYSDTMQDRLLALRQLIIQTAIDEKVGGLEETLKWGQPSYITKQGTTIRIGVYDKNYYALYVHCQTRLIETYKAIYGDSLMYSGKRALLFAVDKALPVKPVKHCVVMALHYHRLKHLPLLGN